MPFAKSHRLLPAVFTTAFVLFSLFIPVQSADYRSKLRDLQQSSDGLLLPASLGMASTEPLTVYPASISATSYIDGDTRTEPSDTFLNIINTGSTNIDFRIETDVDWISLDTVSGSLTPRSLASHKPAQHYDGPLPKISSMASGKINRWYQPAKSSSHSIEQATAAFNVTYTGFNEEKRRAFQKAVDILSETISSNVIINIDAEWDNLGGGILGQCGATDYLRDFANAPKANTYYPIALAEKYLGYSHNGGDADISVEFNTLYENMYYFGADGNCPDNQYDFTTIVLHELVHGLGFIGALYYTNGIGKYSVSSDPAQSATFVFDQFLFNTAGDHLITSFPNNSLELGTEITTLDNIHLRGIFQSEAVPLYTPSVWSQGSSIYHVAEIYNNTENALMTFSSDYGESNYQVGPIVENILQDIGWNTETNNQFSELVSVSFSTQNLSFGTYSGTIQVIDQTSGDTLATIPVELNVSPTPIEYQVTSGSSFELSALYVDGINSFTQKPEIYVKRYSTKYPVKVLTQDYPTNEIQCLWNRKLPADWYDLYAIPYSTQTAVKIDSTFTIKEISFTTGSIHADTVRTTNNGTEYDVTLEIHGRYFGKNRPVVGFTWEDESSQQRYISFQVTNHTMNPETGVSSLTTVGKNLPPSGVLTVSNGTSSFDLYLLLSND